MIKKNNSKKKGAAIIEYVLLVVMLVLVAVAGANFLGVAISGKLTSLGSTISNKSGTI